MGERERIGTVILAAGRWNQYRAACATCSWSWTGQVEGDLRKAAWYVEREIQRRGRAQ